MMLLAISSTGFAMSFSQPIHLGHAGGYPYIGQSPYYKGGVFFEGTTYNDGKILQKAKDTKSSSEYDTGLARWGNGKDALYCKYKSYDWYNSKNSAVSSRYTKHQLNFGGKEQYLLSENQWREISKIETDEGITIYVLYFRYNQFTSLDILGCRKDGTWVKYIDMGRIIEKYFGKHKMDVVVGDEESLVNVNVTCINDTIEIPYYTVSYSLSYRVTQKGAFRFKWDSNAQWFGVEQVVY